MMHPKTSYKTGLMALWWYIVVTSSLFASRTQAQIPEGFEFVRLANDPQMQHSVPDINDLSEVVWGVFILPGLAENRSLSRGIIRDLTVGDSYEGNPAINNNSQMAWLACEDTFGPFSLVTNYLEEPVTGREHEPAGFIDMNDFGDIVWKHTLDDGTTYDVFLYTHVDGKVHQLTQGGNNQSPRINNGGEIVWVSITSLFPWVARVMLYSQGAITRVGPDCCGGGEPDINDRGEIVWEDGLNLYLWNGQAATIIALNATTPRINDQGEVAFAQWNPEEQLSRHAIWKKGQIFVMPSFGLTHARRSLNNRGEMAMRYLDLQTGKLDLFLLRRVATKGDFDHDCRVDLWDRAIFENCFTGKGAGTAGGLLADCTRADFDEDGDVDLDDLQEMEDAMAGPDVAHQDCVP